MTRPDIILREKRISVYNGENGSEDGSDLELVSSDEPGTAADIKMNTDLANIEAGGGESDRSEGDLKLNDTDDDIRVQITAQSGGRDDPTTDRVWINGGEATVEVGGGGYIGDIRLNEGSPDDPRITIVANGRGRGRNSTDRVWMDGGEATVEIGGDGSSGEVTLYGGNDSSRIQIDGTAERVRIGEMPNVVVSGRRDGDASVAGEILVGGDSPALAGELVRHPVRIVSRDTSPPSGTNDYLAGVIQLRDGGSQSAQLRGDQASLSLGYAEWDNDVTGNPISTGIEPSDWENGSIRLHDGRWWIATITAEDGKLKFSGAASSEPYLVVDTSEQEINVADGWTLNAPNLDGG